jgi:hypothetical protein
MAELGVRCYALGFTFRKANRDASSPLTPSANSDAQRSKPAVAGDWNQ